MKTIGFPTMSDRLTKLSASFLYTNAHKQHNRDKGPYKLYYFEAQKDYGRLTYEQRRVWSDKAVELSVSNDWKFFHGLDVALKCIPVDDKQMKRQLLDLRNFACLNLYFLCKDIFEQQF